jgi:HAD superfamily hydrolase (TIGR01509 family)
VTTNDTDDQAVPGALPAAVLWDMDGTLIDSEKLWGIALLELLERLGGTLTERLRTAVMGSTMDTTLRIVFAEIGTEPEPAALAEAAGWLTNRAEELFRTDLPWRPGAEDALRAVRAAGVPTALVTSTQRGLTELALDTIGREFFDITICGDEVPHPKPHPAPYLLAAERLGADPASCVAIEDSPAGVAAAVAAGCLVIGVPCEVPLRGGERLVIRDSLVGLTLSEITGLLRTTDSLY